MTLTIGPIRIKETLYLRIPKDIVNMIDAGDETQFSLKIKLNGRKHVLEYQIK